MPIKIVSFIEVGKNFEHAKDREKRFGPSSDPNAVWHFANPDGSEATSEAPAESVTITQVQDMQPDEHTPDDTYVSFFTSAGCPTNDYSEAARRISWPGVYARQGPSKASTRFAQLSTMAASDSRPRTPHPARVAPPLRIEHKEEVDTKHRRAAQLLKASGRDKTELLFGRTRFCRVAPALYGARRAPKMGEHRQKVIFSRTRQKNKKP